MGRNAGSTLIVALFSPFLDLSNPSEFPVRISVGACDVTSVPGTSGIVRLRLCSAPIRSATRFGSRGLRRVTVRLSYLSEDRDFSRLMPIAFAFFGETIAIGPIFRGSHFRVSRS